MFKLLIADDEKIERDAIKFIVNENFAPAFDIFEAVNGKEAVEKATTIQPDIIFFDIKMPGINGLEAAAKIKQMLPDCRIVIVSAYHYFNYAKEALSLGADEYITKPAPVEKVVETMRKAISSIEAKRARKKVEEEKDKKLRQIMQYFEDELLALIAYGEIEEKVIEEYFIILNIQHQHFLSAVVSTYNDSLPVAEEIEKRIFRKKIVERMKIYFHAKRLSVFIRAVGQEIYILLLLDETTDEYESRLLGIKIFSEVKDLIFEEMQVQLNIGMGNICNTIPEIYNAFLQARSSLRNDVTAGEIVSFGDISKTETSRANALLTIAKEYLESNYQKDISLEDVALSIQISPFYLSKLFKKETGENFIDYLTGVRIRKAKEFLTNPLNTIKDVSYQVGYKDPNYFTRVFKKICGITPTEYQEKNL